MPRPLFDLSKVQRRKTFARRVQAFLLREILAQSRYLSQCLNKLNAKQLIYHFYVDKLFFLTVCRGISFFNYQLSRLLMSIICCYEALNTLIKMSQNSKELIFIIMLYLFIFQKKMKLFLYNILLFICLHGF